jgi:hypothetical protein
MRPYITPRALSSTKRYTSLASAVHYLGRLHLSSILKEQR